MLNREIGIQKLGRSNFFAPLNHQRAALFMNKKRCHALLDENGKDLQLKFAAFDCPFMAGFRYNSSSDWNARQQNEITLWRLSIYIQKPTTDLSCSTCCHRHKKPRYRSLFTMPSTDKIVLARSAECQSFPIHNQARTLIPLISRRNEKCCQEKKTPTSN